MSGSSYMTSLQRRESLKRKYEAYNQARSRLSQSQDAESEPADKVPFTQHTSVPQFSAIVDPSSHQGFNSFPDFTSAQFLQSTNTPNQHASFLSSSLPFTSSFQQYSGFQQHSVFPGPPQITNVTGSPSPAHKPYSFTPPVGFSLPSNEVTNVKFNSPSTSSPTGFRFDTPQFSSPNTRNINNNNNTTTTTTTTTSNATNTSTTTTTSTTNPPSFFSSQPEGYAGLKTSIDCSMPPPPPPSSSSHPQHRVSFSPALPQRAEQEWVRTKDKCTIVLIGPCNLGKKFLINTILSTSYETKRAHPTLGRHRSDSNLHTHTPMNNNNNNNINNNNNTNSTTPTSSGSNNVSINIASTSFDFELIESNPPISEPSSSRLSTQEYDLEFPLDGSFQNGMDWDSERQAEMQEIYAMSQYCLSKSHTIKDERAFVIPQGNKKINATSQLFTVSYDRTPQVVVTFLSEADLRLMLWQLHENYEQGGKRSTLSHSRLEFLHHIYRMVIDTNPPLTGSTILSYLSSSHELPIRSSVRSVLGKIFRYCGNGKDPVVDRIYVREKIREVMVKYQYLIKGIEVKVPSSVLHGGRKEIIILSDTTAHGHIRSSHIIQYINTADMVLLAVDNNGLTNELASLLISSRFLHKLTKDPRKVMALDLSEGRRANQRTAQPIKEHLVAQFRRLYRDVDSASLRNSLPKIFSDMEVLALRPLLFASLALNSSVPPEFQGKITMQSLKSSTNMPLLLDRISNLSYSSSVKLSSNRSSLPISPAIPVSSSSSTASSSPSISAEQLASTLKQRLHVTDGSSVPPPPTSSSLAPSNPPPPTISTPSIPTQPQPQPFSSTLISPPVLSPSIPAPHASNPLLRSKFEYFHACMVSLLVSNESDYEFAKHANECCNRALTDWEQHFRDKFMSSAESCGIILDPKYKGECLGVNISFLLFAELSSWAPYFWRDSVLARVGSLQSEIVDFSRRLLEIKAKAVVDSDPATRMQQHTLLQYCSSAMEKSIGSKFVALYDAMKIDVSSIVNSICAEHVSKLLAKSLGLRGVKQYHKLITDSMRVMPYDVAGAIKSRFADTVRGATQHLHQIELHLDQLLLNLANSQNQLRNMDPTTRHNLQQKMFANMRFGFRGGRPVTVRPPNGPTRDDAPVPNAFISNNNNEETTMTPNNDNAKANNSDPTNNSNNKTTSPNNSFNNTFTNNSFHNNTISNKVNFSTSLPPRPKSDLPVPPHSPFSLTTLCIQAICRNFNKIHALQSGLLPEELVHRIIACLISDEMSVYIKQLDSSILGKLLDNSLGYLDFENSTSLYPSSCMVIAARCHNLRRLNLTNCINIDDESLHHIASTLQYVECLSLGGCYQVGDAGVVALARGCPNLYSLNLSGCVRITDVSVQNLLVSSTNLQTLILRKCVEITDAAFDCMADKSNPNTQIGSHLLQLDLSECRNISDRTLSRLGSSCKQMQILNLSGKSITDEGVTALVDGCSNLAELELVACESVSNVGIQAMFRLSQLRVFSLSTNRTITDAALAIPESDSMSDITDKDNTVWPNLQVLTLSKCPNLSGKAISTFARQCSQLATVDFSFTQMTDDAVVEISRQCTIRDMDLSSCREVSDVAVVELARKCSLRKLVLAGCVNITDASLIAVSQCAELQVLDVTQCELVTDAGLVKVAQGCAALREISLAECPLVSDVAVLALGAAVDGRGSGCYELETVRLAYCAKVTDSGLHTLSRGCPNIRSLDLSNCSSISPQGLRTALRTLTKLQTLRLKGFHLWTGTEAIIDGVLPSLKVLNLSWCSNIEDSVLVGISTACPALEHCDITRCTKITNDAVRKLAENCSHLRQLNLTGCKDVTQGLVNMLVKIGKLIKK